MISQRVYQKTPRIVKDLLSPGKADLVSFILFGKIGAFHIAVEAAAVVVDIPEGAVCLFDNLHHIAVIGFADLHRFRGAGFRADGQVILGAGHHVFITAQRRRRGFRFGIGGGEISAFHIAIKAAAVIIDIPEGAVGLFDHAHHIAVVGFADLHRRGGAGC